MAWSSQISCYSALTYGSQLFLHFSAYRLRAIRSSNSLWIRILQHMILRMCSRISSSNMSMRSGVQCFTTTRSDKWLDVCCDLCCVVSGTHVIVILWFFLLRFVQPIQHSTWSIWQTSWFFKRKVKPGWDQVKMENEEGGIIRIWQLNWFVAFF